MMLSVKEVASLLGIPEKKIFRLIEHNSIPFYNMNDSYQFNRVELLEWATQMGVKVSADTFKNSNQQHTSEILFLDALKTGTILYNVKGTDKSSVLHSVVHALPLPSHIHPDFLCDILLAREKMGSTGIGDGIAIPHVRNPVVVTGTTPMVALCFLDHPIDFDAIDKMPVQILFTIFSPSVRVHLHLLARLGYLLQHEDFKNALNKQSSPEELLAIIERLETLALKQPLSPDAHALP